MTKRFRSADVLVRTEKLLCSDVRWSGYFECATAVHLAVLVEPFLTHILEGRKTIESRFSVTRSPPYNRVSSGDLVLLKRSSGPVVGVLRVGHVENVELTAETWPAVRALSSSLCADANFWSSREAKRFATLLGVGDVRALPDMQIDKVDRRPWVVLREAQSAMSWA